jgi:molybdopterin synthase catalytic subunit
MVPVRPDFRSEMSSAPTSVTTLAALREQPLSVDEAIAAVRHPSCGALVTFIGLVRDHVASRTPGVRLAAVHRVGALEIGDLAVVVAVSAPHRGEAFGAARDLIDTLKSEVPIWKHQRFDDGSTEWVGLP